MTIKNIIYSAHQRLEQVTNFPVKRSHVYELLAAAFGFNTYASLTSNAILIQRKNPNTIETVNLNLLQKRTEEFGYRNILTTELPVIIQEHQIGALTLADLIVQLKNNDYLDEYDWEHEDSYHQVSPEVLNALETLGKTGSPLAHYALALHHENRDESDEDGISNDYWYKQMQSGRELGKVEKEFAIAYQRQLTSESKYQFHLREAARLGCDLALLDLAEKFGDHAFFIGHHRDVDTDPMRVAEIAGRLSRYDDRRYWLTVAADAGNIGAMRELIESYEMNNLVRCWTWVYLSQLLGKDLTQDRYFAINEDGSSYNDDIGGPLYAAGEDGVNLPLLNDEQHISATHAAENLFNRIKV